MRPLSGLKILVVRSVVTTCAVTGLHGGYKVARRMSNWRMISIFAWNETGERSSRAREREGVFVAKERETVIPRGFEKCLKHTRAFFLTMNSIISARCQRLFEASA